MCLTISPQTNNTDSTLKASARTPAAAAGATNGSPAAAASLQRSLGLDLESSPIAEGNEEGANDPPTPLPAPRGGAPRPGAEATPPPKGERLVLSPAFPTTPGQGQQQRPAAVGAKKVSSPSSPNFVFAAAGDAAEGAEQGGGSGGEGVRCFC
jgi:hypothetical protein